jgi:hypothetical protein
MNTYSNYLGRGCRPPEEIANMLPSTELRAFYLKEKNKMKIKRLADILDNEKGMLISDLIHQIKIKKTSTLKSSIIFEFNEALAIIRSKLPTLNTSSFVPISDISREFRSIWGIFYPGGVIMTATETEECIELFDIWKCERRSLYKDVYIDNIKTPVEVVPFKEFEEWFLSKFSQKILIRKSDRLLDHILRTARPKRVFNPAESRPSSLTSNKLTTMLPKSPSGLPKFPTGLPKSPSVSGLPKSPAKRRASMTSLESLTPANLKAFEFPEDYNYDRLFPKRSSIFENQAFKNQEKIIVASEEDGDPDDVYVDNLHYSGYLNSDIDEDESRDIDER